MALGKDYATQECSIARALEIIGERWTLLVVRDALYGVRRYNDFLVHLGIPRAVLAARLQTLTAEGILEKRRYQESPPRDEYVITERGTALWPTLRSLGVWGREHFSESQLRYFRHVDCGTELGPYGECPACRAVVPVEDVLVEPGPGADPNPTNPVSRALLRPKRLLEPIEQPTAEPDLVQLAQPDVVRPDPV
ncbi:MULTISPECIES: helix-turn-helix domain-containing protein [unclassified Streptomyces]|uniref:winged helix-turn-helix transcriptional regulator n=1 Tax=unclassified Streptomyces TaxID=2593676 RepID=UPI0022589397|nr:MULTISPECIES: helix-turn-helix domain-containing protein [unclassified Streptomyces]MCX5048450.1 helix-turn-helix transcriptional regulator [Streptomyces sp. NBC_00474]